ncbi:MAG: amino acid adenylation domain-containing protein, partial [Candidatus Electrothrix sp. AR4]|nr:amino acid adenylation domain-containing protein [Candidatus Electrothrix sp. AR4]
MLAGFWAKEHLGILWLVSLMIEPDLSTHLKQVAQDNDCTLYMLLLATFNLLLSRYSGEPDILIGSPAVNRPDRQLEGLIGLFLNTLLLRTKIPQDGSFRDLLQQVRHTTLDAYAHQEIPFELLVEHLNPQRSLSYNPLFQVMLNLVNVEQSTFSLQDLRIERMNDEEKGLAKFDLNLTFHESETKLQGHLDYDASLFHRETIEFLGECFVNLLRQIVDKVDQPLHTIPLLSNTWHRRINILRDRQPRPANKYTPFSPGDSSLSASFQQQVRHSPDHPAVVTDRHTLTYRQLDERARQLVTALLDIPETNNRVALLFPHDADMIIGIIGTLLAGKAYVPLDTYHPTERLRYIIKDTEARILVCTDTTKNLADQLITHEITLINLDRNHSTPTDQLPPTHPESLAYLLYTSGSTGQPKGVMQSQRNILHFIRQYTDLFHIHAQDRMLQLATYAHDAAVIDIFAALLNGATLYPFNLKESSLENCLHWIAEKKISIYHSTPSIFRELMAENNQNMHSVRLVIMGGEASSKKEISIFQNHFAVDCLFANLYGQSESSLNSVQLFDHTTPIRDRLSLGHTVADTKLGLLSTNDGKSTCLYGEIIVYSKHVALGYWRQDAISFGLTSSDKPFYRTGDLARRLPDGTLEYLGRIDHQVKLRGFRIELGEIETALTQHEMVSGAVVVPHEREGNKSLAAYITETSTLKKEDDLLSANLRGFLKETLPDYMIPASFTVLERLPLTPNGKIDRKALPEPNLQESGKITAPRTETEMMLAALWSAVLQFEVASVTAHFFELGGHSLLATQLASRIRDSFEVDLPLRSIFEYPVLADLAEWIDGQRRGEAPPTIEARSDEAPLIMSHTQHRLWFLNRLEEKSTTYNMPSAIRLTGKLDINALRKTFLTLTERHQSLRMRFPEIDGKAAAQLIPPYDPLTVADLSHLSENKQEDALRRRIRDHGNHFFDIAEGPLLCLDLLVLGRQDHALLINIHHIISDAWSMGVLKREWTRVYTALRKGETPELKPLPIQYSDYAAWQKERLTGELLDTQLAWWEEQLAGAPPLLELPADYPRPAIQSPRGARLRSRV